MDDIVVTVVFAVAAKIMLIFVQSTKKPKKKRTHRYEPAGVRFFGQWYWWVWANRAPAKHQ